MVDAVTNIINILDRKLSLKDSFEVVIDALVTVIASAVSCFAS